MPDLTNLFVVSLKMVVVVEVEIDITTAAVYVKPSRGFSVSVEDCLTYHVPALTIHLHIAALRLLFFSCVLLQFTTFNT